MSERPAPAARFKRLYWRPHRVSGLELLFVMLFGIAGLAGVERFHVSVRQRHYSEKLAAAQVAKRGLEVIRAARLAQGLVIDPETDPAGSGLIGSVISPITSNTGHLAAKQTTINPNFAAVMVHYFKELKLRRGDLVAVGFSGSFPALNLATLAALETLGIEWVAISSASASQFGANDPKMLWIDMERLLMERELVRHQSAAASFGAIRDIGGGLSPEGKRLIERAIERNGLVRLRARDLRGAIAERMKIYRRAAGDRPIKAYVNVGGGAASTGTHIGKKLYKPGINRSAPRGAGQVDSVMNRFAYAGVPILHILRIHQLAARYGLAWAPHTQPAVGEGDIYVRQSYNKWLAAAVVLALLALLTALVRSDLGYRLTLALGGGHGRRPPEQMI